MNKKDIFDIVNKRLENNLPEHLLYHDADHTKTVIEKSVFLAEKEGLSKVDIHLIKVAALYHDAGFLIGRENHEEKSCQLASKELPDYDFSKDEIKTICGMINATRIPQKTHNIYEEIVADADLFYLGTKDYDYYSSKLFQELKHYKPNISEEEWLKIQLDFLHEHKFHTSYAKEILNPVKKENIERLLNSQKQLPDDAQ